MRTATITKSEMDNVVALCATMHTKISIRDNEDSVSAVIPSWNREYITEAKKSDRLVKAYVGVILANRKKRRV